MLQSGDLAKHCELFHVITLFMVKCLEKNSTNEKWLK